MSSLPLRALSKGRLTRAAGIHRTHPGSKQGVGPQWRAPQEEREVHETASDGTTRQGRTVEEPEEARELMNRLRPVRRSLTKRAKE